MEEGSKSKKTGLNAPLAPLSSLIRPLVFVGGVAEEVNEAIIYEHFSTFGAA